MPPKKKTPPTTESIERRKKKKKRKSKVFKLKKTIESLKHTELENLKSSKSAITKSQARMDKICASLFQNSEKLEKIINERQKDKTGEYIQMSTLNLAELRKEILLCIDSIERQREHVEYVLTVANTEIERAEKIREADNKYKVLMYEMSQKVFAFTRDPNYPSEVLTSSFLK